MNKLNYISIFSILCLTLILASCSSEEAAVDNSVKINEIINTVKSGTWHISSYIDSGKDETNDYQGYNFTFNEDGSLVASNGTITMNGTWSVTDDSSSSSSNDDDDIDFNIAFLTPPDFEELSDDWDIVTTGTSKIDLKDISGGNGSIDLLTFEKN